MNRVDEAVVDEATGEIVSVSVIEQQLAEATTPAEVRNVDFKIALALKIAKTVGAMTEQINELVFTRIDTIRQGGGLLNELPRKQGKRNDLTLYDDITKLSPYQQAYEEAQMTRQLANFWERVFMIPQETFDAYKDECIATGSEASLMGLLVFDKRAGMAQEHQRRVEAAMTPAPSGKYRCLVIDPPWDMQKIEREVRPNQGDYLDYPTMSLDDITALPVRELAYADGCHLYLWTTHKYLPDALKLVTHWGFNYQCLMTWVKPGGMTPYSWMYNTEHVIFARMGDLPLLRNGLKLSFDAPATGHSVKPDAFYERVLTASPQPRLEMFSRRDREGFAVWGNQVHAR